MVSVRLLGNNAATNHSTRTGQASFANNVRITPPSLEVKVGSQIIDLTASWERAHGGVEKLAKK
jgi:hypothetical protein